MSAPDERVREILSHLIADAVDEREPARIAALHELRGLVNDIVRQVTISQHAADVTSIAHMWAEARRAHLTRKPLPPVRFKTYHFGSSLEPPDEWDGPHPETTKSANRLSGLARRLERACLGPRPGRVILAGPTEEKS